MKNKISFLAFIAIAFSANCANASECVGKDCELTPVVLEEEVDKVEILAPQYVEPEPVETCDTSCSYASVCPFTSMAECEIWYKKPVYKTASFPRSPHMNPVREDDVLYAIYSNYDVNADNEAMAPLVERYKILMNASRACCSEGIIYKMRQKGASDAAVYQFLKDDANEFAVASRCMVMNDDEIAHSYSNGVTGQMVADVRNACLCKNRQWFESLLEPFFDIYERAPLFAEKPFVYNYTDGMQRDITVYINDEIQTTHGLLEVCPK